MQVFNCFATIVDSAGIARLGSIDLVFMHGVPHAVFQWTDRAGRKPASTPSVVVLLDSQYLHRVDWTAHQYMYEMPISHPQAAR